MPALIGRSVTLRQGALVPPIQATADLVLSSTYALYVVTGAVVQLETLGTLRLYATASTYGTANGVNGTLSGYSFAARCGSAVSGTLSEPTLSFSATTHIWATMNLALSGYSFSSSGTTDTLARVTGTLRGPYALSSQCGAGVTGTLPTLTIISTAVVDALARVTGTLPRASLVAHATQDEYARVVGILPALRIAPSAVVIATLPRATLFATASGAVSVEYEAYSFSLLKGRDGEIHAYATHYTNFPFDRMVRFNDKYYGVAADGLYELNGDTFDGAPIVATVQTVPTDFGAFELKRPFSLYMGGRVGADFRVSVVAAETKTYSHNYLPVQKQGARNYRTLFGKGERARYLAYAFTNTDGGDFELDDITPEIAVLRRRA